MDGYKLLCSSKLKTIKKVNTDLKSLITRTLGNVVQYHHLVDTDLKTFYR